MNDKLKGILHTAWTEPRHFFCWLAMLSIAGFIVAAVGTELAGPSLLLAFVALGCILGLAVSIPAFIGAWIPPIRRLFTWLLARRFVALGCLVTLVALFYAVENWRGRRAWQSFKHEREAKGERFDLASLTPPPVPADQNFFETPLWSDLHSAETNGTVARGDVDDRARVVFAVYGPHRGDVPNLGNWMGAQRVDLAAWQDYYRGSNEVAAVDQAGLDAFRRRYGLDMPPAPGSSENAPLTNYFPIAKEPQTPAADVLLALSKFETNRQLLIAAAARPQARFWVNYEAGFGVRLPHLPRLKGAAQYLSLHAIAALKSGDRQTALEDLKLAFRLMEAIRPEPNLIGQLVRMAVLQLALQPVWEGLADRQWTEAELGVIESELGKLNVLGDYQSAMRGERALCVWAVDYVHRVGIRGLDNMGADNQQASPPRNWEQSLSHAAFRLVPAGWFDQNKASLCRTYEAYLLPAVDRKRRVALPAPVQEAQAALEKQRPRPYDALSRLLLPAVAGCAKRFARVQASIDLARVACVLERYRQANGQFPETLAALAPKFIAQLPHDVINGQPLKYRRTEDGQYVLYSVGWNETDEGGEVGLKKSGNLDVDKGDWVWRYPAE